MRVRRRLLLSAGATAVIAVLGVARGRTAESRTYACPRPTWVASSSVNGGTPALASFARQLSEPFRRGYPLVAVDISALNGPRPWIIVYRRPPVSRLGDAADLPDEAVSGSLLAGFRARDVPVAGVSVRSLDRHGACSRLYEVRLDRPDLIATAAETRSASELETIIRARLATHHLYPSRVLVVVGFGGFVRLEFRQHLGDLSSSSAWKDGLGEIIGRENVSLGDQLLQIAGAGQSGGDAWSVPGVSLSLASPLPA